MLFSEIITTSGRYVKRDHPHSIEKNGDIFSAIKMTIANYYRS